MNLEVEAYAGELRNLRKFRDDILEDVQLPEDVAASINTMDATDMTKECLREAIKSIHALKKTSQARLSA